MRTHSLDHPPVTSSNAPSCSSICMTCGITRIAGRPRTSIYMYIYIYIYIYTYAHIRFRSQAHDFSQRAFLHQQLHDLWNHTHSLQTMHIYLSIYLCTYTYMRTYVFRSHAHDLIQRAFLHQHLHDLWNRTHSLQAARTLGVHLLAAAKAPHDCQDMLT